VIKLELESDSEEQELNTITTIIIIAVMWKHNRISIKGLGALGKLAGCDVDFTSLVSPSRGKIFLMKNFSSKSYTHL